jgi:serine/threonine protein kinase
MKNKPAVSITEAQPAPEGLGWTNLWIEEEEDLTVRPAAQVASGAYDADAPEASTGDARNLWIEEEEDLRVRPLPASTVMEDGNSLEQADASTVLQEGSRLGIPEQPLFLDATTDPFAMIRRLLDQANRGEASLAMFRGWTLVRELGRGGMGAVALIERSPSPQTQELLALKVMLPQVAANPQAKVTFEREIEIAKALVHPHIVPLRQWGCWQEIYFFASDYCDGGDVHEFTEQHGGKLLPEQALPMIFQTLEALDYAHHAKVRAKLANGRFVEAEGVVHRDVKPSNIFLCGSGDRRITKLGDFDLAKAFATAGHSGVTWQGAIGGSIKFMPQQLLDNFLMATPAVDVWSAAASLYYMLTGQPPRDFSNEPHERWLWVVSNKPPVPIRQREASIPPALAEVIDHALDDRDSLHFTSAAGLKRALESVS